MELGGKSANIVFASADYQRALDGALSEFSQTMDNNVLLAREFLLRKKSLINLLKNLFNAQKIMVGDPLHNETEIGPIASKQHMERILSFAEGVQKDGDKLLVGKRLRNKKMVTLLSQPLLWLVQITVGYVRKRFWSICWFYFL